MSRSTRDGDKVAAELISKGATMLGEPCPQCGGIQLRFHGKVFCVSHQDLSSMPIVGAASMDTVVAAMKEVLLSKLNEAAAALDAERDEERQERIVSLMTKYFDLLQRLPK